MSDFNIVDGVILAIVIVSSFLAYSRGLVRELMSIAAWIIAAFFSLFFRSRSFTICTGNPIYWSNFVR